MATRTPRTRTPRSSRRLRGKSPIRTKRIEEKQQLNELNKRLENYIIKNREKDASAGVLEREIQIFRDQAEEEMQNAQDLFQKQLGTVRRERDEAESGRARLQGENDRLRNQLQDARDELEQLRGDNDRLREQTDELTRAKQDLELRNMHQGEELENLRGKDELNNKRIASLQNDVDDARAENEELSNRAADAESKLRGLEEDLDLLEQKSQDDAKRLRRTVDDLTHRNAHIEEITRKEFANQLQDLLAEKQSEWEGVNDEALRELKDQYEEKLDAYRDHLERAGHELEEMKKKLDDAQKNEAEFKSQAEEAVNIKVSLEQRIDDLEEEISNEKQKPNNRISELLEVIRRIKASFKRKDKEFDDLMDVKIALAMEIKHYRELLEKEEERLGYTSPAAKRRKRKRGESALDGVEEKSRGHDDLEGGLVISRCDLDGGTIKIKNTSTTEVSLDGYSLQNDQEDGDGRAVFEFPDVVLQPAGSVTVWTGSKQESKDNPPSDLAWPDDDLWSPFGDKVLLVNPDNEIIAEKAIVPQYDEDEPGRGPAGSEATEQKEGDCCIM